MVEFRVLGSLDLVRADGSPVRSLLAQPKRTALLAYLAVEGPGTFHRRDTLLTLFWPERDRDHARNALNQSLYFLRQNLGPDTIRTRGRDEVGVDASILRCDAAAFRQALEDGDPERALETYRGDLLEGFHVSGALGFERWRDRERKRLRQAARDAAVGLATESEAPEEARRWLQRALEIAPSDEEVVRHLMRALDGSGDRAGALRAYRAFAARLERRLGIEPSPETRELAETIRERTTSSGPGAHSTEQTSPSEPTEPSSTEPASGSATSADEDERVGTGPPSPWGNPVDRRRGLFVGLAFAFALAAGLAAVMGGWNPTGAGAAVDADASIGILPGDTLVLADFAGPDSVTANAMTEAVRVDLEQSPAVVLLSPERRRNALLRMARSPDGVLPLAVARELARREGLKGAIGGSIQPAGEGYVLTVRLVAAEGGEPLVAERETADDDSEVVPAIGRLSNYLRERVGESLKSIQASQPLERVATSSLEALKMYTRGARAFELERHPEAVGLLERAVRLDTAFAFAYRKLGIALGQVGRVGDARDAFRRAYAHRDRLSEYERTQTVATYHYARGDPEAAAAEYEAHLLVHPGDAGVLNNLAHSYLNRRRYDRAEEIALRMIEERPEYVGGYRIAAAARMAEGELDLAAETLRRMAEALPNHPSTRDHRASLAHNRTDYDEAEAILLESLVDESFGAWNRADFYRDLARIRATRGKLAEADSLFRLAASAQEEQAGPGRQVSNALARARVLLYGAADTAGALDVVRVAVEAVTGDSIGPWDLPYLELAAFEALAADTSAARRHLARRREAPDARTGSPVNARLWRQVLLGTLAMARNQPRDAVQRFRAALEVPASIACGGDACVLPLLARAHRAAGDQDAELRTLERFVSAHSQFRLEWDALFLGPTLERLGELHEDRGDAEGAVGHYRRFVDLWEDADSELQPRVERARDHHRRILDFSEENL